VARLIAAVALVTALVSWIWLSQRADVMPSESDTAPPAIASPRGSPGEVR